MLVTEAPLFKDFLFQRIQYSEIRLPYREIHLPACKNVSAASTSSSASQSYLEMGRCSIRLPCPAKVNTTWNFDAVALAANQLGGQSFVPPAGDKRWRLALRDSEGLAAHRKAAVSKKSVSSQDSDQRAAMSPHAGQARYPFRAGSQAALLVGANRPLRRPARSSLSLNQGGLCDVLLLARQCR
jgi:hypothetical protein